MRQRRGRPDGTIYFTDSSRRHDLEHYAIDVIENVGTGRDLRRAPDGRIDVLHSGLRFANGVALSPGGTYLVVAESGARVLVRVPVDGGEAGIFADDLPGHPDNVTTSPDGTFWVALPRPRSRALDTVHRLPRRARQAVAHAARPWASAPARRSRVLELGPARRDRQRSHGPAGAVPLDHRRARGPAAALPRQSHRTVDRRTHSRRSRGRSISGCRVAIGSAGSARLTLSRWAALRSRSNASSAPIPPPLHQE
ncbi:SMP-30/gluconolactonase/LRE family protein [Amycolatopsis sp. NPDC051371]|uniref:SMP-30/gluconolactonase/LRE family protein n=1 Tax=Amycolatopsis sp. NPDC051371 TaxID=3155800 RepID=UPI003423B908